MLKRLAAAVAPLPPENAAVETVPSSTGCEIAEGSTTHAVPVMVPLKLITPSAAYVACRADSDKIAEISANFFIS